MREDELSAVTEAVLVASRVFVAVAAESLADLGEITLPQYRAVVTLSTRGPQHLGQLAEVLDVNPSTATRLCDRLVRKGLVGRVAGTDDRREVTLTATAAGEELVATVTKRRRAKVRRLVKRLSPDDRAQLVHGLGALAGAGDEAPEQAWTLGWFEGTPASSSKAAPTSTPATD
jgi:DNA-binding MarR family transcriptional regulator